MKKLFYLLIGVMLLTASCSNDSETDLYTEIAKNEQAMNEAKEKNPQLYDLTMKVYFEEKERREHYDNER